MITIKFQWNIAKFCYLLYNLFKFIIDKWRD